MVAITTFAQAGRTIREGEEVSGADSIVTSHTSHFAPAGTPKSEWPAPPSATLGAAEPAPPAPIVVATRTFLAPAGHAVVLVAKGDRFRTTHELVRLFRESFASG
jgi:hypothetical protein